MLVLSRKIDESIILRFPDGTEAEILIADITGHGRSASIKLGITAPRSINVRRHELNDDGRGLRVPDVA